MLDAPLYVGLVTIQIMIVAQLYASLVTPELLFDPLL